MRGEYITHDELLSKAINDPEFAMEYIKGLEALAETLAQENQRLRKSVIHLSACLHDAVGFMRASAYELMSDHDVHDTAYTMLHAAKNLESNSKDYRTDAQEDTDAR